MQVQVNSESNTVTLTLSKHELAVVDYAVDYWQARASVKNVDDATLASQIEQALFKAYCVLIGDAEFTAVNL